MPPRKKKTAPVVQYHWSIMHLSDYRNAYIKFAALVITTASLIGAWKIYEPYFPAHREYVREQAGEVMDVIMRVNGHTLDVLRDQQLDIAEGKRQDARQSRAKWVLEFNKATDATTKSMAEDQISELDATLEKINDQIKTLQRVKQKAMDGSSSATTVKPKTRVQ